MDPSTEVNRIEIDSLPNRIISGEGFMVELRKGLSSVESKYSCNPNTMKTSNEILVTDVLKHNAPRNN